MHSCQPCSYFCSEIDDFRPTQATLLTRFATIEDCSDQWRTSNQDYGAFYYRTMPDECIADRLKAKVHRRHARFQNWLSYQAKCQNSSSLTTDRHHSNSNIFPFNRHETVRITHRKKFASTSEDQCNEASQRPNPISLSPCGEDGLITEYIVKRIVKKLQCLISPGECQDVAECAHLLVSEILTEQPSLSLNDVVDRVVKIMTTTPPAPLTEVVNCPSSTRVHQYCQTLPCPTNEISMPCPLVNVSGPLIECQPTGNPLAKETTKIFDNLIALENAIGKLVQPHC